MREPISSALEAVTNRFANMVRQVGRAHRLDEADLDEVMQEVRIRLWRAHEQSEPISAVSTSYVYKTARSVALDLLRRRSARHASDTVSFDEHVDVATTSAGPEGELETSELAAAVARALQTIPESRRAVVRMYLAGYPREEIASLMGWTEAKTRNLLYRGLADLRERLERLEVT